MYKNVQTIQINVGESGFYIPKSGKVVDACLVDGQPVIVVVSEDDGLDQGGKYGVVLATLANYYHQVPSEYQYVGQFTFNNQTHLTFVKYQE